MKATINGKRYDTNKCEILGEHDMRSYSGNYAGTLYLLRAANGQLLEWCDSNGQDCHISDYLVAWEDSERSIDDYSLNEAQEARCAELGLLEIVG